MSILRGFAYLVGISVGAEVVRQIAKAVTPVNGFEHTCQKTVALAIAASQAESTFIEKTTNSSNKAGSTAKN